MSKTHKFTLKLPTIVRYVQEPVILPHIHTHAFGFQLSLYIIVTHTHNRQQGAKKSKKALQTEKEIKNGENGGREENNRLGCERPIWVTLSLHLHSQVHFSLLSIYDMNLSWFESDRICLQRDRTRGCSHKNHMLWNLPHRSSSNQKRSWHVKLPHGSWVTLLSWSPYSQENLEWIWKLSWSCSLGTRLLGKLWRWDQMWASSPQVI